MQIHDLYPIYKCSHWKTMMPIGQVTANISMQRQVSDGPDLMKRVQPKKRTCPITRNTHKWYSITQFLEKIYIFNLVEDTNIQKLKSYNHIK